MISKTGMHALRALVALAGLPEGAYAGSAEVAGGIGAPRNYLGKLLQTLIESGLVVSQKGKGGGFRLARDPAEISILDVVEPIDRPSRWEGCFLGRRRCEDRSPCAVHRRWTRVRETYLTFLRETTLADLAGKMPERADLP